jgi:hypothetical protein
MSHIIQDFGNWKRVNEDDLPGRERERGGGAKVVAIPIDVNTLKLKLVRESDVINAEGKLTIRGFDAILNWIKSQGEIIRYYNKLNDLTANIVVYSVSKDNERKQILLFKIYSKNDFKPTDPTQSGINSQVRFVREDELQKAISGTVLNVANLSDLTDQDKQNQGKSKAAGFKFPFPSASILNSIDQKVIDFIIIAYYKIKKDPRVAADPIMNKVRAEAKAGKLGIASQLFIQALNAGFNIQDDKFRDEFEVDITQTLYDKINYIPESREVYLGLSGSMIVEAESPEIPGFDTDAFLAVAKQLMPDTGDIKVPEGGFTEGMQANPELAKFQSLLYRYLKKPFAGLADYANFAAKKGDGAGGKPVGNYGKTTSALVLLVKQSLDNPVWSADRNGKSISAEFVKRIQDEIAAKKLTESISQGQKKGESLNSSRTYLGLDGTTLINEDLNPPSTATKVVVNKPKPKVSSSSNSSSNNTSSGGSLQLPGDPDPSWRYKVVNGQWNWIDSADKNDYWGPLKNPKYVKQLIHTFEKGDYVNVKKGSDGKWTWVDKNRYNFVGGVWKVWMNNAWYKMPDPSNLIKLYGADPTTSMALPGTAGATTSTPTGATTTEIDSALKEIASSIKTFVEGPNFSAYKGDFDDDEEEAWDDVLYPKWTGTWKPKLDALRKKVNSSTKIGKADKDRYAKSFTAITNMFTEEVGNTILGLYSFYAKFMRASTYDIYTLKLFLSGSTVIPYEIDCDI